MNAETHFPVIIVGAGPTGLLLANLLGEYGLSCLVIERGSNVVGEPRAVTIDDESLRTVQAAGLIDKVLPQVVQGYGVHYFSWRGKEFARIEPSAHEYGFQKRNAFRQQVLVGQLRDGLARFNASVIWFGHELISFEETHDGVVVEVKTEGQSQRISCRYLVACDGGRSRIREQLHINMAGTSYDEKWLIVDMLNRTSGFRHTRTYCDPVRPAIRLPGPNGTLRYEFMLHSGESAEKMVDETLVRRMIAHRDPADAGLPITRKVVYAFSALVAEKWQIRSVFLAGDAAHLTPPFAGQGMNSGVRDAANLAWKLAAVVQGHLSKDLLYSYEQERKPHAWSLIKMAVHIGQFMQPKTVLSAILMQCALKLFSLYPPVRDYVQQLKFKPKPRFFEGFFVPEERVGAIVPNGQLLPQPWLESIVGARIKLDDAIGHGFVLLALNDAPIEVFHSLQKLPVPVKVIQVLAQRDDFLQPTPLKLRDCDGTLEKIIRSASASAVLLRPDRYVLAYFGKNSLQDINHVHQLFKTFSSDSRGTL